MADYLQCTLLLSSCLAGLWRRRRGWRGRGLCMTGGVAVLPRREAPAPALRAAAHTSMRPHFHAHRCAGVHAAVRHRCAAHHGAGAGCGRRLPGCRPQLLGHPMGANHGEKRLHTLARSFPLGPSIHPSIHPILHERLMDLLSPTSDPTLGLTLSPTLDPPGNAFDGLAWI
eukprot:352523-Chlamydomonas_euryale.AAC.3